MKNKKSILIVLVIMISLLLIDIYAGVSKSEIGYISDKPLFVKDNSNLVITTNGDVGMTIPSEPNYYFEVILKDGTRDKFYCDKYIYDKIEVGSDITYYYKLGFFTGIHYKNTLNK